MHHFYVSEAFYYTIAIWLIEKVAYRDNRALKKIWKWLAGMRVFRTVKDDMMLIFHRISNLLIGVKAAKLMFWEARILILVRAYWECLVILVGFLVAPCLDMKPV